MSARTGYAIGGALLLGVLGMLAMLGINYGPDLQRYLKIRRM